MLKIKFIIIKAIGRFKKIIAGWAHPAQTTEIFFSGLANDNLHPEQVDGYIIMYDLTVRLVGFHQESYLRLFKQRRFYF